MRRWMPSSAMPIWALTTALILSFPALNFIYWPMVLESGALPPDADSIGIPMFGSIPLTIVAAPFILGIARLCLCRYSATARLVAFRCDRPLRSTLATAILGGAIICMVGAAIVDAARWQPWYEYLWSIYALAWVPWLAILRAALIEQEDVEDRFAPMGRF